MSGEKIPLPSSLQEIVGSLLFASESPLSVSELRNAIRNVEPEEDDDKEIMDVYKTCTTREVEQALHGLEKELERSGIGFRLVCAGGTYRLQSSPSCGRYVRALLHLDRPNRLSKASLETLAIIAYRQPITKTEIEQIRGVAVDTIVKTLVDLQLVRLVGRSELPGHPFLYGTTPLFLEHFGLSSLAQLNEIDPTLPRSDPKERAKLFVKKEEPKEDLPLEVAAMEAAQKAEETKAEETAAKAGDGEEKSPEEIPDDPENQDTEFYSFADDEDADDEVDSADEEDEFDDDGEEDGEEESDDEDEFDDDDEFDDEDDEEDDDEDE
jgi:segregation and condensation protein B